MTRAAGVPENARLPGWHMPANRVIPPTVESRYIVAGPDGADSGDPEEFAAPWCPVFRVEEAGA